jgi:hypothetical protein
MTRSITPLVRCTVCDFPATVEIDPDCFLCEGCEALLIEITRVPVEPGNASTISHPAPGSVLMVDAINSNPAVPPAGSQTVVASSSRAATVTNSIPTLLLPIPPEASETRGAASSAASLSSFPDPGPAGFDFDASLAATEIDWSGWGTVVRFTRPA